MSDDHWIVETARSAVLDAYDRLFVGRSPLQQAVIGIVLLAAVGLVAAGVLAPQSDAGRLFAVLTADSTLAATLRLSVPIAFAALGGIFAEKSGVINIGLEGLLIIAAFVGIWATDVTGSVWYGLVGGVLASTLLAGLFAIVCIEFRADQIIAGLAVWLIALGLAPFLSSVIYGSKNSTSVDTFPTLTDMGIPFVSELVTWELGFVVDLPVGGVLDLQSSLVGLPFFGALFDASPPVYLMLLAVALSWYTLHRTAFGRWVEASGENPKALDTAGVNVHRVRYAAVLLSGVLAGVGGAALALGVGQFTGNGPTMVNGKGFIAIVAYLFGNYNPVGALASTMLFAGLDATQLTLQARDVFQVPTELVRTIPYVTVIVVLALFGRTRIPSAGGEHYESGEDE
ncbi:ABC transporter permease [Halobacterium noricense]|uniref:ABC transporter permease n=1 Tax=Halobacterium noricense TaxID=223182 RepID=UPI001E37B0E3|nr:ABC transporter permease [Halobacterium noricense]UHH26287.1 ABC transporter permease [Halobacterium noricense]